MTIKWSRLALEDLFEIEMYIFNDNPERALTFIEEFQDKVDSLLDFPMIGVKFSEKYGDSIRELHYQGYTIIYEIMDDMIVILEVFQSKIPRMLKCLK